MPQSTDDSFSGLNALFAGFTKGMNPWHSVKVKKPEGSPIVLMYSRSNNEFSIGHFTLERGGVPVTHWQPLEPPPEYDNE